MRSVVSCAWPVNGAATAAASTVRTKVLLSMCSLLVDAAVVGSGTGRPVIFRLEGTKVGRHTPFVKLMRPMARIPRVNINEVDLNLLRAFDAILRDRSVTAA